MASEVFAYEPRALPEDRHGGPLPKRTQTIAMFLFLVALSMLFASSMFGYAIIRLQGTTMPPLGTIELPWGLWVSTAVVLMASYTIQMAVNKIRRERQDAARQYLIWTLVLSVLFIFVQAPSLWGMLEAHAAQQSQNMHLYGLIFTLVVLHAVHVIGGVIFLALVLRKAWRNEYDHEHHTGITHAAWYWHFLDIVWLVMFGTMFLLK